MRNIERVGSLVAVFALLLSAGCSSSTTTTSTTTNPVTPTGAHTIYVVQNSIAKSSGTSDSILELSATASGSVSPTTTVTAPVGVQLTSVAVDNLGTLYVGSNAPTPEVFVVVPGTSGSWTPQRTISGSNTSLTTVQGVAVDPSGLIYVANGTGPNAAILVFAATASGNVAPIRTITSSALSPTPQSAPDSIAADASFIYVADYGSGDVFVFSSTANGSTTPLRTLPAPSYGVGVDGSGDIYTTDDVTTDAYMVQEYQPGANGSATPTRSITRNASAFVGGVAVDAAGTMYLVVANSSGILAVEVFPSTANGSVSPSAVISSAAWTNDLAGQIAIN